MNFTKAYWLIGIWIIISGPLLSQVNDDFTDGDFSNDPAWIGDEGDFEIDTELQLHLNASPEINISHLVTASSAINNASWEISVNMDFNPSSTSSAFIYLTSDQTDLESDLNGYYVMIGNSADEISLYRQDGSSSTVIIDGNDDVVDLSSVEVRIRVTRDETGLWELFHDVGLSGTYVSEGTTIDNTYSSSNYFGVACEYIASRADLFWFDDVLVTGEGFIDDVAPELLGISNVNASSLDLLFNEPLDITTAENELNYTLTGSINPTSASLSGNVVTLDFDEAFETNVTLTIQVVNVTDLAGNAIIPSTEEFIYIVLGIGMPGDIVINELMSDPSPVIDNLPEAEYLELYNTSDSAFDLLNWNIKNDESDEFLDTYTLLPGEHVIICDDNFQSLFSAIGPTLVVSTLTALSNGGDSLRLFNAQGELIDQVIYDISWYGGDPFDDGGYSLERINPDLPCDNPSNWTASQSPNGGTPGFENSVFIAQDSQAPQVQNIQVVDNGTIIVNFNEGMDELSLITGTYTIPGVASIVPDPILDIQQVILSIDPPLENGAFYDLTVENVSDCSGNEIVPVTFSFFISAIPEAEDVIINEIMADPSPAIGLPEKEYLELFNRSDKTFDLDNWILRNSDTDQSFNTLILEPGDHVIICDEDDLALFTPFGTALSVPSFTALSNSGDDLYLLYPTGEFIDQVIYNSTWYNDPNRDDGGYSLERINPDLPCSDERNWRASTAVPGGTPGFENAVLDLSPDVIAPQALSLLLIGNQQLELSFNEPIELSSIEMGDIMLEPELSILGYIQPEPNKVQINLTAPLDSNVIYTVTISGIADCSGNELDGSSEFQTALPSPYEDGDLIINEVLFNPNTGGVDFVEIYNNSARPISLKNWKIANRELGELTNIETIVSDEVLLLPGDFKVITEDPENIRIEYPLGRSNKYLEISDLPSYPDDEGYVVLLDPAIEVHDEFFYNEDYHFSLLDDLDGISLERVDYDRLTNDPTNWHSAAQSVGWATPGYENSQLQPANLSSESFTIEPEVFSPDNDGFEDLLLISYSLDKPGYVANIRIFDRDGRLVRMLVRNELLATRGTVSWDGINDEGSKARIGVYVLFIEIFDQEGNVSSTKKTAVLGGRL